MGESSLFNIRLGEMVRRLVERDGRSMEAISLAADMGPHTVSRIVHGYAVKVETLMAVLYELDAGPSDLEAIYADFAEYQREKADG